MKKITYDGEQIRIDKYLADTLEVSREKINKMIKTGLIMVGDQAIKPSYMLNAEDEIAIGQMPVEEMLHITGQKMDLDIVYEDNDLMVINKPSGLVVHPAPGHQRDTLVNGLIDYVDNLSDINGILRPGIVHRLDKDTSGLLVVAKNNETHVALQIALQDRKIKRTYLALVHGLVESDTGTIKAPLGRDLKDRLKQSVRADGKAAITHFLVVKRFIDKTLLQCDLDTGRTHQIRVHMAYIGHPVVGDPVYSKQKVKTGRGQLLHAYKLEFEHPKTHQLMSFTSDLPDDFNDYLNNEEGGV